MQDWLKAKADVFKVGAPANFGAAGTGVAYLAATHGAQTYSANALVHR